jgi:hypothetical protein
LIKQVIWSRHVQLVLYHNVTIIFFVKKIEVANLVKFTKLFKVAFTFYLLLVKQFCDVSNKYFSYITECIISLLSFIKTALLRAFYSMQWCLFLKLENLEKKIVHFTNLHIESKPVDKRYGGVFLLFLYFIGNKFHIHLNFIESTIIWTSFI